jgi:hypothetical protein
MRIFFVMDSFHDPERPTARRVRYGVRACFICQSPKSTLGLEFNLLPISHDHPQILTASARNFSLPSTRVRGLIIATMASKFMVNAVFGARLLLRPSHRRAVLFGTVDKLECPISGRPTLPPILSSRSYSDSTSTPPFPKTSGSTEGSQSSGPKHKNCFFPKVWGVTLGWGAICIVRAGSFYVLIETC